MVLTAMSHCGKMACLNDSIIDWSCSHVNKGLTQQLTSVAKTLVLQDEVWELEFQGWKKKFTMLQVYSVDIAGSLYQRGTFLLG